MRLRRKLQSGINTIRFLLYPGLRIRAQDRLYKAGVSVAAFWRAANRRPAGTARNRDSANLISSTDAKNNAAHERVERMQSRVDSWKAYLSETQQGRERGTRRQKLAGYLKAANELRQSYARASAAGSQSSTRAGEFVSNGDEQLILFPSYAKWKSDRRRVSSRDACEPESEFDHHGMEENASGIIDVDVRGWLFRPHSGPLTRKNRMFMSLARRLCGLPALPQESEEESASGQEVENTMFRSENLADARSQIPADGRTGKGIPNPTDGQSAWKNPYATINDDRSPTASKSTKISEEHAELLTRIAPFMHQPLAHQSISVFIYNDTASTMRTIETCERGHFALRASVDFIPTHIRVFVNDKLSIGETVNLVEDRGMSLISDIDDTIKHSAVTQGTREIFRHTFIKSLDGMVIDGVREWYNALASEPYNVSVHYVSNSPWQLYPLLRNYLEKTGLPNGSFHLKQYSGMFAGIFEPVAERKRASLERIIRDFPERKWILVGDSGEMDLEVYSEIALMFPGRIKGIFIRDVLSSHSSSVSPAIKREEMLPENKTFFTGSYSQPDLHRPFQPVSNSSQRPTISLDGHRRPPPLPPKPQSLQSSRIEIPTRPPPPQPPPPRRATAQALQTNTSGSPSRFNDQLPNNASSFPQPMKDDTLQSLYAEQQTHGTGGPALDKRIELWNRRWEYARNVLERNGVVLRSWKAGTDVLDECLELVKRELRIDQTSKQK